MKTKGVLRGYEFETVHSTADLSAVIITMHNGASEVDGGSARPLAAQDRPFDNPMGSQKVDGITRSVPLQVKVAARIGISNLIMSRLHIQYCNFWPWQKLS